MKYNKLCKDILIHLVNRARSIDDAPPDFDHLSYSKYDLYKLLPEYQQIKINDNLMILVEEKHIIKSYSDNLQSFRYHISLAGKKALESGVYGRIDEDNSNILWIHRNSGLASGTNNLH